MCLFTFLKWNCLIFQCKYFIDTEIARKVEWTVSPDSLGPFFMGLGICMCVYVLLHLNFLIELPGN